MDRENERKKLDQTMSDLVGQVHIELLQRLNLTADSAGQRDNDEYLLKLERTIDTIARSRLSRQGQAPLITHTAGHGLRDHMLAHATVATGRHSAFNGSPLE